MADQTPIRRIDSTCCGGLHAQAVSVEVEHDMEYRRALVRVAEIEIALTHSAARKVWDALTRYLDGENGSR